MIRIFCSPPLPSDDSCILCWRRCCVGLTVTSERLRARHTLPCFGSRGVSFRVFFSFRLVFNAARASNPALLPPLHPPPPCYTV